MHNHKLHKISEYSSAKDRYILYGAAADVQFSPVRSNLKQYFKKIRDRFTLHTGFPRWLDYRNYTNANTFNRGDHAIIESTELKLLQHNAKKEIKRANWGTLGALNIKTNDVILICGSGYIFPSKIGKLPSRIHEDVEIFKKSRSAIHLIGVGANQLLDWNQPAISIEKDCEPVLQRLIDQSITLTTRDLQTANLLAQYTSRAIEVIGDPALYFPSTPRNEDPTENQDFRIGINLPFHGKEPTEWLKHNLTHFAKTIKAIRHFTGGKIVYLVHYDSELIIAKALRSKNSVDEIIYGDTTMLAHEYGKIQMHIGGMLHSCILATAAGTPCIGLAYDVKHHGFFEFMGRSEYCLKVNPFNSNELLNSAKKLFDELNSERINIIAKKLSLEKKFDAVLSSIIH